MAAYFIVSVQIDNPASRIEYDLYIEKVKPIVEMYGGKYIIRSEDIMHLSPNWKPDRMIVIEFQSIDMLNTCFSSAEYSKIKDLRVNSVEANAIILQC